MFDEYKQERINACIYACTCFYVYECELGKKKYNVIHFTDAIYMCVYIYIHIYIDTHTSHTYNQ